MPVMRAKQHASIVGIVEEPTTDEEIARRDNYYAKLAEMSTTGSTYGLGSLCLLSEY